MNANDNSLVTGLEHIVTGGLSQKAANDNTIDEQKDYQTIQDLFEEMVDKVGWTLWGADSQLRAYLTLPDTKPQEMPVVGEDYLAMTLDPGDITYEHEDGFGTIGIPMKFYAQDVSDDKEAERLQALMMPDMVRAVGMHMVFDGYLGKRFDAEDVNQQMFAHDFGNWLSDIVLNDKYAQIHEQRSPIHQELDGLYKANGSLLAVLSNLPDVFRDFTDNAGQYDGNHIRPA